MTSYTVTNRHGSIEGRGLTLAEAAIAVMTYDGHEFEIRLEEDGEGYRLWTSQFSRNSAAWNGLRRSVIFSLESDEAAAKADIYRQVVERASMFLGCEALTDAEFDRREAEIEIGMTVEGGRRGTEDHDVGRVVDVAEDKALVAWQSGVRTWSPIEDLTEVES